MDPLTLMIALEMFSTMQNKINGINEILFSEWDPIEVFPNKLLIREYNDYAVEIVRMIRLGCSKDQIIDYLQKVELGLNGYLIKSRCEQVAEKILLSFRGHFEC
jgi:hypothetical protein